MRGLKTFLEDLPGVPLQQFGRIFHASGTRPENGSATTLKSLKRFSNAFQHWALSLIGARPLREGEGKGADRGVDGLLYYYETERKDLLNRIKEDAPDALRKEPVHREKIIVQVKGGRVNRGDVATLLGDVNNQKAAGGVLITLEKPSKQMRAGSARSRPLQLQALAR